MNKNIQQRRKFFMVLPALVVPFLVIAFYALGGGGGYGMDEKKAAPISGFNMELPPAILDPKEDKMDKLDYYARADADSARKKEQRQMDPYLNKRASFQAPAKLRTDTAADALLRKLDLFKNQIGREEKARSLKRPVRYEAIRKERILSPPRQVNTARADPELDRLSEMLDKIARLQGAEPLAVTHEKTGVAVKEVSPDVSVAIPAVVDNSQELMNGATLSLRLTSAISYHGLIIPRDQLVYGMVSMSGDRMQVGIHSIRCGSAIITTSWQVYDMDGLQGIRIPDGLGRQVARQSADQGVSGLNIMPYDPSIGGQMAGAGIQVAKNFLGRRMRTVRVMVPAGYQVLLRETRMGAGDVRLLPDTMVNHGGDAAENASRAIAAPPVDSLQPYLHVSAKEGKVKLSLKGIYLRDDVLWFYMALKDESVVGFVPGYVHCSIRQAHHWKRMAVQEVALEPVFTGLPSERLGSEGVILVGLKPFVLARDKRLVVQVGEKNGGRSLILNLRPNLFDR